MHDLFRKFAHKTSEVVGSPFAFFFALTGITAWAVMGPRFGYSTEWHLVINTFTTITTFLIVFLIQNTQNRESKAFHLKLDELLRSSKGRDSLIDLEDFSDDDLNKLAVEFRHFGERAKQVSERRRARREEGAHKP